MATLNSEIRERDFSNSPELEAVQKFEADLKQSGFKQELNIQTPENKHDPDLTM